MADRVHLVDGTFELYRAHFSPRPGHTGPRGEDLKATVGLLFSLLGLLHDEAESPTHVAVAFDNPIRSFRNDLFPFYKSDEGVPPELRAQFDLAELAVRAAGVVVWSMREMEADDAIATATARLVDQVDEVRILSPDKDFGQCLRGEKVVIVDRIRRKETREAELLAAKGFAPAALPDFLALTGDTADGIPGIPGFGEKTAGLLCGTFGGLDAIPDDPALWPRAIRGAPKLAALLAERREDARLYRTLATLRVDAPIDASLEALRFDGVPRASLVAFSEGVAAPRLLERVTRWRRDPAPTTPV
jgi:5'-3' exonuclease